MGLMGEPSSFTDARKQRQQQLYPELQVASPGDVLKVDGWRVQQGGAPTQFSASVMRLGAAAAQQAAKKEQP